MDTSNPANLLILGIYLLLIGGLTIFSLFSIYLLLRYGQNRTVAFLVSAAYSLFYLILLNQSYQTLISIK